MSLLLAASSGASATGTLAWTEENDVTAIAATVSQNATLAWTEDNDVCAVAATVSQDATLAWTEADDVTAIAATVSQTAVLAWTEVDDVTAIAADVSQAATLSWTEADDVTAITADVSVDVTLAWVEEDDVTAIGGSINSGLSPRAHPEPAHGSKHPWIHGKHYALPDIGEIEPEIAQAVVKVVDAVIVQRSIQNAEIDTAKAEREFRLMLEGMQKQWADQYAQLIWLEYDRREQEMEDAAIAMLLFEM